MAGRILSKTNETKLRAALMALGEVLGLLDKELPAEDDASTEDGGGVIEVRQCDIGAEYVPLVEKALRTDGTLPVKLIAPGWGSSGYYPAEVLQRDGPAVFTAGTKMYWNHPTLSEEVERPEGDLDALAAELVDDARWRADGPAGPGLYADAKVFGRYRDAVEELGPHIGVSIRASGRATQGEADGKKGPIIDRIVDRRSVDFVTEPGAGGQIVQMFEAARRSTGPSGSEVLSNREQAMAEQATEFQEQLREAQGQIAELRAQNARLHEALLLRDAREYVRDQVAQADVPDVTQRRLVEQLSQNPPTNDQGLDRDALRERVAQAITAETEYLAQAAGWGSGRIRGMGNAEPQAPDAEALQGRMREGFARLGLSERELEHAVAGRVR